MLLGKEMLKGYVSIPGIKGGNQTFIHLFTLEPLYSFESLATHQHTHTHRHTHPHKLWEQIILKSHISPTAEQSSWVTVGAAASAAGAQITSNLLYTFIEV